MKVMELLEKDIKPRDIMTEDALKNASEAEVGGNIALIEDGDIIKIDIETNSINFVISDEELEKRRANWKPRQPKITTGYLARYAALVTSGNRGAVLEIPKFD